MPADPSRLYTALLNTGLQQKDNALYQVIHDLIGQIVNLDRSVISINSTTPTTDIIQQITNIFGQDGLDGNDGFPGVPGSPGPVIGIYSPVSGNKQNTAPLSASLQDFLNSIEFTIYWQYIDTSLKVRAQISVRANSTTTVIPSIYNTTDSVTEITGSSCSATNSDYSGLNQQQTLAIASKTTAKKYKFQLQASDNAHGVWGSGYAEIVPTSA